VYGYNDFDFELLFKDYKADVADLRKFGAGMVKYIQKN